MAMGKLLYVLVVVVISGLPIKGGPGQEPGPEAITGTAPYRIHTLFSVECKDYFDWETVALMHSFRKANQPGQITRLLSCTEEQRKGYKGMDLAPTFEVPSMSIHPRTGDWYSAINKPVGIAHWVKHSKEAESVDWVVILDADMIIRGPIIPWELGAENGKPVAAYYGYLIGCDNILAELHTKHPELCDKVGGLLVMHIDDLRALAPYWVSKTEEVRADRDHWPTNYSGDVYGNGWISEMYGYSFGAAEVGLRHKINDNLMHYPGDIYPEGVVPILFHYGLPFEVGNWSFNKLNYSKDSIAYDCGRLFPEPPYPREVKEMDEDEYTKKALMLNLECINTINEALLLHHAARGCPNPKQSKYVSFLRSKTFAELTKPVQLTPITREMMEVKKVVRRHPKIHTIFSTECTPYSDWQTVGLVHSFHQSGQPGEITRLLSCTDEDLKEYKGHDLAPTHYVPSMSFHPLTGDWYPGINKPASVVHWVNHVKTDAEYVVILDSDMIMRGSITPWEFNAAIGRPVSTPYECDNELAKPHTINPGYCDKFGGVIIMHIRDLKRFSFVWLHKTEELRADMGHWAKNFTGDIYKSGWIIEMYGYSLAAAEMKLQNVISNDILIYPGLVLRGVNYRVFHYGLELRVGNWSFDKAKWKQVDLVNECWAKFPDPPHSSTLNQSNEESLIRELLNLECINSLNQALNLHHENKKCPNPNSVQKAPDPPLSTLTRKIPNDLHFLSTPVRKIDEIATAMRFLSEVTNRDSREVETDQAFGSMRFFMVGLWGFSGVGFIAVMVVISRRKVQRKRGNAFMTKKISSYPGA